jgi:radical SAM protein with 4Fe4S-binding SPASM domain
MLIWSNSASRAVDTNHISGRNGDRHCAARNFGLALGCGWNGDGTHTDGDLLRALADNPGVQQDEAGNLRFADWNCRAGENNVVIRTDGTIAPCFPLYPATYDWGNIENIGFDYAQLQTLKKTCQRHCFSTLNHNLAYCYNDARVMKWLWQQARRGLRGGAQSFD